MATEILYTPLAEVRWAHLVEPRPQMDPEKPLAWSVDLLLPLAEPTSQGFLQALERQFIEAHGSKKRRSDKGEPWKPDKEQPAQLQRQHQPQQPDQLLQAAAPHGGGAGAAAAAEGRQLRRWATADAASGEVDHQNGTSSSLANSS